MKSIDYIKERLKDGYATNIDINKLNLIEEVDFITVFNELFDEEGANFLESGIKMQLKDGTTISELVYDGDAEYNYFSTSTSINDGTLYFDVEPIADILKRVLTCQTYNSEIMEGLPNVDEDRQFYETHHIKYTVGDFVVGVEFADSSEDDVDWLDKDRPWLTKRTTAMLPIKFEIVE